MRLLLAEDEQDLSKALVTVLKHNNYSVDAVFNGEDALTYLENGNYDGVILDIMMPKSDGLTVLKNLRQKGNQIPVLLLSAKSEIDDRVTGLDLGADDYLTKPFSMKELLARIRAITRRKGDSSNSVLSFSDLTLNRATFQLSSGENAIRLANREFQMMEMLMTNPGHVISAEQFMEKIWGFDSEVEPNVVTQVKTAETDGYNAIQLATVDKKEKRASKASVGHAKKANTTPKRYLKEIRDYEGTYNLGDTISADVFTAGEYVDVTGTSKGKGTEGVIKRWNQSRGPMAHGSRYHRGPGSMGTMRPMRVLPGKKLPGHMGVETTTIQNLEIIEVNAAENYILVSGNIPGAKQSLVLIKTAVKKNGSAEPKEILTYVEETVVDEVVESETPAEEVEEVVEATEENQGESK